MVCECISWWTQIDERVGHLLYRHCVESGGYGAYLPIVEGLHYQERCCDESRQNCQNPQLELNNIPKLWETFQQL